METTLKYLIRHFPQLHYQHGKAFCWSPKTNEVFYTLNDEPNNSWSLLHETSHAVLRHTAYRSDFELLHLETLAWEKAKEIAQQLHITISEDHVQDCLDSYRDWIYARSVCPRCKNKSLQQSDLKRYRCFNCHHLWRVTSSRFCRTYRATENVSVANHVTGFDTL
jgi:hypothetical protein